MPRLLAWIWLAVWAGSLNAQPLDLYAGEVLVTGKTEQERQAAVPSALIHVLQRLSGQRELPPGAGLERALQEAERMVLAFHYRDRQRLQPDGSALDETWLVVRFSPPAVDRVVVDLALPRWRQERPPLTFWIVVDDGLGRRLMPVEYGYAWDAMTQIAAHRGLPITWGDPGPDAGPDLQLLWGGFTDQLDPGDPASGGTVVIAARRLGPDWQLRWNYDSGIETVGWRSEDRDLSYALSDGLHRLTDLIASRDSISGQAHGEWRTRLAISGLRGPDDYARCLGYLEQLSLVDAVRVEAAAPGQVDFELTLNAEPRYLADLLRRDGVLEPSAEPDAYRLLP